MTDTADYAALRSALSSQGFTEDNCEFLVCDNSEKNLFSAYAGVRLFLREAKGKYVLILHQDAIPLESAEKLLNCIEYLELRDPLWGVIGNAGKLKSSRSVMSILSAPDTERPRSPFVKVETIDENMMIIRNGTGITLSADMGGYHFYAFDLCSVAARLGYNSYVVDHLWRHDSHGAIDEDFFAAKRRMERKMSRYHGERLAPTTCTILCWACSPLRNAKARALSIRAIGHKTHRAIRQQLWQEGLLRNPLFLVFVLRYRLQDAWGWLLGKAHGENPKRGLPPDVASSQTGESV